MSMRNRPAYSVERRIVRKAAGGLCVKCGDTMEEVHHVYGGDDNTLAHIRPLCYLCHLVAPSGDVYWEWERVGLSGPDQAMLRIKAQPGYDPEFDGIARTTLAVLIYMRRLSRFEIKSELTSAALQQKIKRGERTGTVPYGFRVGEGKKLAEDAAEQAVIARIRVLRSGGASFREIAAALNDQGITTRRGTPWRFQYVANVLGAK